MSAEESRYVVPTKYWHRIDDGRVQCDVCPRFCKLHEGQRGLCFVRARQNDEIVLTTYGRSSGYCVDPVEKKPLNHFLPGSAILSFGTAGCNLSCSFCFHPDTLVATTAGQRRIEDLFLECDEAAETDAGRVGFPSSVEVWTREAKRAPLAKVFAHEHDGELLSLKASCCPPVLLTANHKVFAAHRASRDDVRLVPAGELSPEHFLVVPKRPFGAPVRLEVGEILARAVSSSQAARPRHYDATSLVAALRSDLTSTQLGAALGYHPAYVRTLRSRLGRGTLVESAPRSIGVEAADGRVGFARARDARIPETVELSADFAWLLGLYCAEGCVVVSRARPNSAVLSFTCGPHEEGIANRAARILEDALGVETRVVRRRTTLAVECANTAAARLFEALCGRGSKNKRVPAQLAGADEDAIRGFLDGYFAGDGYASESHMVGGTVSRSLAYGIYELGLHLGLLPTFFVHEPAPTKEIGGRTVSQATTYIVKFPRNRFEGRAKPSPGRTAWHDAGTHFLVPVRGIERTPYTGTVYNLEVDDTDHSYLAPFLAVSNCQNWDISKSRETDTLADQASPEAIARAAERLGCRSVAFTYNDPTIFLEYANDVADACREVGVKAVAVTAGYICPEPRADFYGHVDAANVDLKAFTERFYRKVCAGHLEPVLETLVYLKKETDVWFEITNLVIPGENDSESEFEEMTQWIVENLGPDVPIHFTAFHPDYKMREVGPTPPETLARARAIAVKNGMRYAYTGNVHDKRGGSTYCHGCGATLVGRDWYRLSEWNLTPDGACRSCGTACAGVFDGPPGTWGAKRLPVFLGDFSEGPRR